MEALLSASPSPMATLPTGLKATATTCRQNNGFPTIVSRSLHKCIQITHIHIYIQMDMRFCFRARHIYIYIERERFRVRTQIMRTKRQTGFWGLDVEKTKERIPSKEKTVRPLREERESDKMRRGGSTSSTREKDKMREDESRLLQTLRFKLRSLYQEIGPHIIGNPSGLK